MNVDVDTSWRSAMHEEHFSQYPQPPELSPEDRARAKLTSKVNDEYVASLEQYIDDLGAYIRSVQAQEVRTIFFAAWWSWQRASPTDGLVCLTRGTHGGVMIVLSA